MDVVSTDGTIYCSAEIYKIIYFFIGNTRISKTKFSRPRAR